MTGDGDDLFPATRVGVTLGKNRVAIDGRNKSGREAVGIAGDPHGYSCGFSETEKTELYSHWICKGSPCV
jgi:hypothetical protein